MKVAIVHDYLNQYGGGERVVQALLEIFPQAPIYTLVYDAKRTGFAFEGRKIRTSFLQKIPFAISSHRLFAPLMPLAVEQFNLSNFDVVISSSASYAKGVITKPNTLHISYCYTPTRYIWDDSHRYIDEFGLPWPIAKLIPFFMNYIRIWDYEASLRVDKFVAVSKFIQRRIKKYYQRDSEVVYPPVACSFYEIEKEIGDFFLAAGRMLPYKRFDIVIDAFNELGWSLKIIGDGRERNKLQKRARKNIEFLGLLPDKVARGYFAKARAFIFPNEEDFGLVAVESMASGRPVIALGKGGVLESVVENVTGIFFDEEKPDSLIKALENFNEKDFNPEVIRNHAFQFDKEIFKEKIKNFVLKTYEAFKQGEIMF